MTTAILPYQEGDSICDLEASTKVISNSDSVETNANNRTVHAWEVLMVHRPRSPLIPQKHPMSGHQMNLSPTYHPLLRATMVRPRIKGKPEKRRNKLKQGRQRRARQRKEAWIKYESDLAEYNRRKSEQEVEERRAANTPYNRIREALEELGTTSHPNE